MTKALLYLLAATSVAVASVPSVAPKQARPGCDAATMADLESRFGSLKDTAGVAPEARDAVLLAIARCHYREGRWREFFGLARYRRAFPEVTPSSEALGLLDVLASLHHCRFDRAKEVFASTADSGAVRADRERIALALAALPGDPKLAPKPGEEGRLSRGIVEKGMHWRVSLDDAKLRQADPFRLQLRVTSRCTATPEAAP